MKYQVLFIAVLLIMAALIAGCTQQAATQQQTTSASQGVIKVGVIASLTGPASNVGTSMWQSAQVAADKINTDGGVTLKDGSKDQIKLIVGDDESTQAGGQDAATKLITDDNVDILVGGYSSAVTSSYEQTIAGTRCHTSLPVHRAPSSPTGPTLIPVISSITARQPTLTASTPLTSSTRW